MNLPLAWIFVYVCMLVVQVGVSAEVDKQLTVLRERVVLELRLHSELQQIQGMLEPILASSLGNAASQSKLAVTDELRPL